MEFELLLLLAFSHASRTGDGWRGVGTLNLCRIPASFSSAAKKEAVGGAFSFAAPHHVERHWKVGRGSSAKKLSPYSNNFGIFGLAFKVVVYILLVGEDLRSPFGMRGEEGIDQFELGASGYVAALISFS